METLWVVAVVVVTGAIAYIFGYWGGRYEGCCAKRKR